MALAAIIRAANRQNKSLDLSRKDLDQCPSLIGQLTKIEEIKLTNNRLTDLPKEMCLLNKLQLLNIGGNKFAVLPINLQHFTNLRSLIAYNNRIEILPPIVLNSLKNVTLLNLNNNNLKQIPAEIGRLKNLQNFSVDHNQLEELPFELCYLERLENLHLGYNHLISLPEDLGQLWRLKRLILHKNCLQELPAFETLPLKQFYYECNPLLQLRPVSSVQEEEVFALKETVARYIMNQMKNNYPNLWHMIITNPESRTILNEGSQCAVCKNFLLNTWLECVKFVATPQKGFKTSSTTDLMPINARLCSYKCFNKRHNFYGIASTTEPQ
ncbi:unnamed protein product [Acanthosepion pharaonis]|uniref:Leucine-rich repeat-containing protein 69 n=1 Tax=Acanthosepion pharaonis TaxID=158019 RepID=A0A812EIR7_ACAPH|nr:unnamed protein product [Sepia pharaonis]